MIKKPASYPLVKFLRNIFLVLRQLRLCLFSIIGPIHWLRKLRSQDFGMERVFVD